MSYKFVPKFTARQEAGNLIIADSYRFRKYVETLGDGELEIVVRGAKSDRSNPQNRYYWGVVISLIADHTGVDQMDLHEILKNKFLREVVCFQTKTGKQLEIVGRSTTELKTNEFEEYLAQVRAWAGAELGIAIPLPNEVEVNA